MKNKTQVGLLAAICLLAAASAQSVALFYDDFSSYLVGDPDGKVVPATGLDNALSNTNVWYINQSGVFFASTGATVAANGGVPPSDSSNGAALRVGFWSQPNYGRSAGINTGLAYDANSNYTFSCAAKVLEMNGNTNEDATAFGQINILFGYYDTNNAFVSFNNSSITNVGATEWTTNSVTLYGGRVREAARGEPIILRVSRANFVNSTNYITWVDWVRLEASSPYGDWRDGFSLSGSNSVMTADWDEDGVDNMTEWATGGDPTNSANTGLFGAAFMVDASGTNRFAYVTPRQVDYWANGVDYYLERNTDLVSGTWTNAGSWIAGVAAGGFNADFDAVTNYVGGVETNNTEFVRLRVSHPGYNP